MNHQSRELSEEDRRRHAQLHKDDGCEIHGSLETPIAAEEKRHDAGQYIRWEYEEIKRQIGEHEQIIQSLLFRNKKKIDRVMVEASGKRHVDRKSVV